MPRFLGLKSYLTTNRSNINKQDATKFRRSRLSEREILRENIADKLKCPLCFCVPCFIGVAVMLVLIVLYVTAPYQRGKEIFYRTNTSDLRDGWRCICLSARLLDS